MLQPKTSTLLVLLGIFGFVVLVGAGILIWQLVHGSKLRNAAARLAGALGWQVVREGHGYTEWFQGIAHGRQAAVRFLVMPAAFHTQYGVRVRHVLRVAIEVAVPAPLGVEAVHDAQQVDGSGAVHFQTSGAGRLSPAGQAALATFSGALHPAGLSGIALRTAPVTRHLRLADRQAVITVDMDAGVLATARVVLIHDYPEPLVDVVAFRKILHELASVAYTLEQSMRERAG